MAWLFPVSQHPIQLACHGAGPSRALCASKQNSSAVPGSWFPRGSPRGSPTRPEGPYSQARHLGPAPGWVLTPRPRPAASPGGVGLRPYPLGEPGPSCLARVAVQDPEASVLPGIGAEHL